MFGEPPKSDRSTVKSIPLEVVLDNFQCPQHRAHLNKFALLGFHRHHPKHQFVNAYSRQHVVSAVILNLRLLKDSTLRYDPRIHVMEDLHFNEMANKKGLLICKCYRYQQVKRTLGYGGCSGSVARPEAQPDQAKTPEAASDEQPLAANALAAKVTPTSSEPEKTPSDSAIDEHDFSQPVAEWSVEKVCNFLVRMKGVPDESVKIFRDDGINGKSLLRDIIEQPNADEMLKEEYSIHKNSIRNKVRGEITERASKNRK